MASNDRYKLDKGRLFSSSHNEHFKQLRHSVPQRLKVLNDDSTVDEVYDSYWKSLVEVDGKVDFEQVKRELYDFWKVMMYASEVYVTITNGEISKLLTKPEVVIDLSDRRCKMLNGDVKAELDKIDKELAELHEFLNGEARYHSNSTLVQDKILSHLDSMSIHLTNAVSELDC